MSWSSLSPGTQSAIIGGGSSLAGSLINGAFQLGGAALQHKYNKELADMQNQYNIDMWNMQNEYNSPTSQMARLSEAGLNPNLAYQNVTTGNSSSAPQQVVPNAPDLQGAMSAAGKALNPEQIINFAINVRKGIAEAQISEEQAREAGANADLKEAEAQSLFAIDSNRSYYFNPLTGQIEQTPENEVSVSRWMNNPYRKQVNIFQASLERAQAMRNEFYRAKNLESQVNYRGDMKRNLGLRSDLLQNQKDYYLYNEILKGVNSGAHLLSSFGGIGSLLRSVIRPKNLVKGRSSQRTFGNGQVFERTWYNY